MCHMISDRRRGQVVVLQVVVLPVIVLQVVVLQVAVVPQFVANQRRDRYRIVQWSYSR